MVKTGFRLVIGSWKIMEMRLPRTLRIAASESFSRSVVPRRTAPPTMRPGGSGISRRIESDVTVLPQPDSPTMATVLPRGMENETSSTARERPSSVKNRVVSPSTRSNKSLSEGTRAS